MARLPYVINDSTGLSTRSYLTSSSFSFSQKNQVKYSFEAHHMEKCEDLFNAKNGATASATLYNIAEIAKTKDLIYSLDFKKIYLNLESN